MHRSRRKKRQRKTAGGTEAMDCTGLEMETNRDILNVKCRVTKMAEKEKNFFRLNHQLTLSSSATSL